MSENNNAYKVVVRIPYVNRDSKIGSVFNQIFSIMFQTEQTNTEGKVLWDFSDCKFLHPFFIGAISILRRQYGQKIDIAGIPPSVSTYMHAICFNSALEIKINDNDEAFWNYYKGKTFLPICVFHPYDNSSIKAQELIQKAVREQLGFGTTLNSIISLLLSELIDNITEHSKSQEGFLFCQSHPRESVLYVMICDTGRSIYSSYAADDRYRDYLTLQESSGLLMALSGKSTKDRPQSENRGYGISKSRKLVVDGLGGEFFILSGSAFARHDSSGEVVVDLPPDFRWNGTAILLKIPTVIPHNFNLYNYIS